MALPILGEARLLVDLGAGTGADAEELDRLEPHPGSRRYLLVDAQSEMLRLGESHRRTGDGSPLAGGALVGDVTRLPLRDGSADVVLSLGLLCCVEEAAVPRAIQETTRILAPGGWLILAVPRWRGRADEAATRATGLVRRAGGRPGRAVFQKPL